MATVARTNSSTQPGASGPRTLSAGDTIDIDGVTYMHPMCVNIWVDDVKAWPSVSSAHIVCYLIRSKACDLKEAESYKSLDSYNFVQSGWVGQVLCHNVNKDVVYLKADVRPSQAINQKPWTAWACVRHTGQVKRGERLKGRLMTHTGALLRRQRFRQTLGRILETAAIRNTAEDPKPLANEGLELLKRGGDGARSTNAEVARGMAQLKPGLEALGSLYHR
ncbi:hypothetical protein HPB49_003066 [Dermacentor silvarum]|uniref:Uncharacterized protein n=1 Tax=Dermacentor silvarum TaxID=543639 RepID=A0ACB8DSR1_DERSI|nr:hypothetical protein HPB49_003066 [Dermacentor silvarum]